MLPNDPGEFERRLTAGDFDTAIHRLLTGPDLDVDKDDESRTNAPEMQDAVMAQILHRGRRLGKSRLWVAAQCPASRLHAGVVGGKGGLSLTFEGPPRSDIQGRDVGTTSTTLGLIGFGSTLQFRCGTEVNGSPLELVLIAKPKVTRNEFNELIGFEKPLPLPEPHERFARRVTTRAMALKIALPAEVKGTASGVAPECKFDVAVDFASSQLRVSTERLEGEDGMLIATVQFDGRIPVPVILECGESDSDNLRGTVPLPPRIRNGDEKAAIIVVHEVTQEELPLLPPTVASLWLAGQRTIVTPLSESAGSCEFTLDESARRFLGENPEAIVAVRVEQQTPEVGR